MCKFQLIMTNKNMKNVYNKDADQTTAAQSDACLYPARNVLLILTREFLLNPPPPIPLDGDSATIRNVGQNDTNCSRNGKSAVEAQ